MTPSELEITHLLKTLSKEEYCYVTTKGRVTGRPHRIEIWFGLHGTAIYLLSGGGDASDWVKNMKAEPRVTVRIGRQQFEGSARMVSEAGEDAMARRALATKYYGWQEGKKLNEWARTALPVAIQLAFNSEQ